MTANVVFLWFAVCGLLFYEVALDFMVFSLAEAPVTRGVIATNRQAVYEPDADVVWNGHSHTAYIVPIARERLSAKGKVFNDVGWFIRTPGYKRDWEFQDGFVAQKGLGPNPIGCARIELKFSSVSYPSVTAYLEVEP